ncbi:MAG: VanZ family protein [Clostridiales bacterium]|nr:VanZ family protein [Clostridiales bacterium]
MKVKAAISFVVTALMFGLFYWGMNNIYGWMLAVVVVVMLAFMYNGFRLMGRALPDHERFFVRMFLFLSFMFFINVIFLLTFSWGRVSPHLILLNRGYIGYYLDHHSNFIPFASIVEPFRDGYGAGYIIKNIGGNIAVLMPVGFFCPLLFKRLQKALPLVAFSILLVLFIEITQFVFMVGTIDVDDLILNVSGAVLMFMIIKIPVVKKLIYKIFPGVEY